MKRNEEPASPALSRRAFLAGSSAAGVVSIDSFAGAAGQPVQRSTDIVLTSGYASAGRGAALYVHDASLSPAYMKANPRTSFVAADGRGFRLSLDQVITPFMFGAVGTTSFDIDFSDFALLLDDTAALQAFFSFCAGNRVESCNWGGIFGVTRGLVVGDTHQHTAENLTDTMVYQGALMLMVKSNIQGAVLTCRSRRASSYGPLTISSHNQQNSAYADRKFDVGLHIVDQAQMQTFTAVVVHKARAIGIYNDGRFEKPPFANNVYQNRILNGLVTNCGSGGKSANFSHDGLTSTTTGRNNEGSGSSPGQLTSLGGVTQPPSWADLYELPLFVRFPQQPDRLYQVMSRDPSRFNVKVFPWVDAAIPSSTTFQYVAGGGLFSFSGDAGMLDAKLACNGNAFGVINAAVYGNNIQATMQQNVVGFLFGSNQGNAAMGHTLNGYFENNDIDFIYNGLSGASGHFTIVAEQALNPDKIVYLQPRVSAAGGFHPQRKPNLLMNLQGTWHRHEFAPDIDGNFGTVYLDFASRYSDIIPLHHDNPLVGVVAGTSSFNRLFGYRARKVEITGTGAGNKPSGTVTVRPLKVVGGNYAVDASRKINGGELGADATFTRFAGPVSLQVALDPADPTNYLVSFMGGAAV